MNYDSYKEWAICTCNGIIDDCNRMTSGNYMHNVNAVKLMAKIIRDDCLPHLFENPKSPWISVEDRLPEIGTTILEAYTIVAECQGHKLETEAMVKSNYNGEFIGNGSIEHMMGGTSISTTHHWMPIPELPKEG